MMATEKSRAKGMASMRKIATSDMKKSTVSAVLSVDIHWINKKAISHFAARNNGGVPASNNVSSHCRADCNKRQLESQPHEACREFKASGMAILDRQ